VPLSEHEQRILRQIERQFQQERGLARSLRMPSGPQEAARNAKRASIAFVVGLLALLVSFASSWVVGLIGFIVMFLAAVVLVQSVRRLVRAHWSRPDGSPDAGGQSSQPGRQPGRQPWGRPGGRWWGGSAGTSGRNDEGPL